MFASPALGALAPSFVAYLISRFTAGSGTAIVPSGVTFITCGGREGGGRGSEGVFFFSFARRVRREARGEDGAERRRRAAARARLERDAHAQRVIESLVHDRGPSAVDLRADAVPPVREHRAGLEPHGALRRVRHGRLTSAPRL